MSFSNFTDLICEDKINLYQSDAKDLLSWSRTYKLSVKHCGGTLMAWARINGSGTHSLILTDNVTHDGTYIRKTVKDLNLI